ncbi:MAG: thioredoxin family protein [Promethearchaeota archaeon]
MKVPSLKWSDLTSPMISLEDYKEKYGEKEVIRKNHESYEPKKEIMDEIIKLLKTKGESLRIAALGAEWCKDCTLNVPRMIKIVENLQHEVKVELRILYGIMVNAFHKKGEILWHEKRSPPEALDPKFDLQAIPTFYLFNSRGEFLGRIIEGPKENSTLEEEIFAILKDQA